jgi:phosphatidylserine/phosphatidylglycerophosphate/cardiolipin synthase-like enzyme
MAEFLTTQGTSYYLENIIINASERLILVSPYLNITANFMARLQDADKRTVEIILIYGKDELKPKEKQKLSELQHLSLYYHKNLHAKCYLSEDMMIITSMNMYEFSEKTNREMGVLVRKDLDNQIYNDALKEVRSILDSAEEIGKETKSKPAKPATSRRQPESQTTFVAAGRAVLDRVGAQAVASANSSVEGHCIRCGREINLDPERPYCSECYGKWATWKNPSYTEHYCHCCGKADKSSMLYPLCRSCYQKSHR